MGLDYGARRIGVAICDELEIAAHAAPTIPNDGMELERIAALARERGVGLVVVGMPYNMDNTEGGAVRKVRSFIKKLRREMPGVDIDTIDERLTTDEAHEALSHMGANPATRRREVDRVAAQLILQRYLERRRGGRA